MGPEVAGTLVVSSRGDLLPFVLFVVATPGPGLAAFPVPELAVFLAGGR